MLGRAPACALLAVALVACRGQSEAPAATKPPAKVDPCPAAADALRKAPRGLEPILQLGSHSCAEAAAALAAAWPASPHKAAILASLRELDPNPQAEALVRQALKDPALAPQAARLGRRWGLKGIDAALEALRARVGPVRPEPKPKSISTAGLSKAKGLAGVGAGDFNAAGKGGGQVTVADWKAEGDCRREGTTAALKTLRTQLRRCATQTAEIQVALTIDAAGKTGDVKVTGGASSTARCVRTVLASFQLPAGSGVCKATLKLELKK